MVDYRQRGMTMWSALFVIGTLAFFLFLFFKLLPPYLEDFKVRSAMDSLMREPGVEGFSKADLMERLDKRFDIDNITNVKPNQVEIKPRGKVKTIALNYEVVVPIFYNVSALIEFTNERQTRSTE